MFDLTGFFIALALFAVFTVGYILFLVFKGTPKFETAMANISVKFKNLFDKK